MICAVVKFVPRAFCFVMACSVLAQPLKWSETRTSGGQRNVLLENDRIRVEVLPDLGGRIVRLVDNATGRNHLGQPDTDSAGIWDKEGIWPTVNFSAHPLHYDLNQTGQSVSIKLWADRGNLRLEKFYVLEVGSPALSIESSYRNIGSRPLRYSVSQIFRLAVGGSTGPEDYVVYPESGGLAKKRFTTASEARPENGSPSWCAVTDAQLGESLLLEPKDNSLLTERSLQFGDKHIQLEYLTRRHLSQPGETLTLSWRLRLVKNLSEAPPTPAGRIWGSLLKNAPASFRELDEHLLISGDNLVGYLSCERLHFGR